MRIGSQKYQEQLNLLLSKIIFPVNGNLDKSEYGGDATAIMNVSDAKKLQKCSKLSQKGVK